MIEDRLDLDVARVREFLLARGWHRMPSSSRYERYRAPIDLVDDYYLTLPFDSPGPQSTSFLLRVLANLAELYEVSVDQLTALFERPQKVFSLQICGADSHAGSIPLLQFESVIDRLKRALFDVASFVATGEQSAKIMPLEAITYMGQCRFLQTEVGSFVAKLSLPTDIPLRQASFRGNDALTSDDVNQRFESLLGLITQRVFNSDREIYSDVFLADSMDLLCVGALDNLRDLFTKSGADSINFRFLAADGTQTYESGELTDEKFAQLHLFVKYVREHLVDNIPLDIRGKVVELRSYNPRSQRNYVKISTTDFGGAMIAVILNNDQYAMASSAHLNGRFVRVIGRARQMKTQIKVVELADFSEA